MNWRLILTLIALATFWGLVGYVSWHRDTLPAIFGPTTEPVPQDDLWKLNQV